MFWSNFGWMGGPTMVAVWQAGALICPALLCCQQQSRASRPRQPIWAAGVQQMSGTYERGDDDTSSTTMTTNIIFSENAV